MRSLAYRLTCLQIQTNSSETLLCHLNLGDADLHGCLNLGDLFENVSKIGILYTLLPKFRLSDCYE